MAFASKRTLLVDGNKQIAGMGRVARLLRSFLTGARWQRGILLGGGRSSRLDGAVSKTKQLRLLLLKRQRTPGFQICHTKTWACSMPIVEFLDRNMSAEKVGLLVRSRQRRLPRNENEYQALRNSKLRDMQHVYVELLIRSTEAERSGCCHEAALASSQRTNTTTRLSEIPS